MFEENASGTPGSESTVVEDISAHLSGGAATETTSDTGTSTPEVEEILSEPSESTRAEERIQQLVAEREQEARRAQELDTYYRTMIASNPTMRNAYAEMMGNRTAPSQQVTQPDWEELEAYLPREKVQQLIEYLAQPLIQKQEAIDAKIAEFENAQVAQYKTQVANHLDSVARKEMPSIDTNERHFKLVDYYIYQERQKLSAEQLQDVKALEGVVLNAVRLAKEDLKQFNPAPPAAAVPKPFSESGSNMVAQRTDEVKTALDAINAHLNFTK